MTPEFKHDCERCTFLGTSKTVHTVLVVSAVSEALLAHINGFKSIADLNKALDQRPTEHYDLYFCEQGTPGTPGLPTVIARYGDDGPDYKSGMVAAQVDAELRLALKLARALKLAA